MYIRTKAENAFVFRSLARIFGFWKPHKNTQSPVYESRTYSDIFDEKSGSARRMEGYE